MEQKQKLNYGNIMVLGTGFMVISLAWALFNSYVPKFLENMGYSALFIGLIMTLDNIAGMTIQPLISSFSDRTWTKHGRRMPFLMIGLPLAAVFFILLPFHFSVFTLMATVVLFDLSMSIFRGPTVALMPDLTPAPLRSKANGVINFMGGFGAIIAYALGSWLYGINKVLPFALTAAVMILVLFILKTFIKEPRPENLKGLEDQDTVLVVTKSDSLPNGENAEKGEGIVKSLFKVFRDQNKSALFLLLAIFSWFIGWNGIEAFFTLYGTNVLGIKENQAAFLLTFFSLTFLGFAIPSGLIATKIGRKKTITAGVVGFMAVVLVLFIVRTQMAIGITFLFGGICWALININSYPMVVEMSGGKVGTYTGLYYFFASIAAVSGPLIFGWFSDLFGYQVIFILGFLALVMAFFFLNKVKSGEATPVNPAQIAS